MISPERLDALQRQWIRLIGPFGAASDTVYRPFDALVEAYSAPGRHYHTLAHIGDVLRVAGRLAPATTDPAAILLAAWFHDAVYDPRGIDNEARSAAFAADWLPVVGVPTEITTIVRQLILATNHAPGGPTDAAAIALIDADLAIFGAVPAIYKRYADAIREEYAFVPEAAYRVGRARVLQGFLDRPTIYRHPIMVAEGEAAARTNLTAELARLA